MRLFKGLTSESTKIKIRSLRSEIPPIPFSLGKTTDASILCFVLNL